MFNLVSQYQPAGDQPQAIKKILSNLKNDIKYQVLLGATGTGKTFTMANVIRNTNKPTLVLAHNKTLAGQLYSEFKELFPDNRVEYFVSYYDYYQPEAYVPSKDLYIEKDSSINDEIDQMRHSATSSLINYKDVIVVASVSSIYGIGEIEEYQNKMLTLSINDQIKREAILEKLITMMYDRNELDFKRGTFRVHGDIIEVIPASSQKEAIRVELFDDTIQRISEIDVLTGRVINNKKTISLFPATHFVTNDEKMKKAIDNIKIELEERLDYFKSNNKAIEYQRLKERTNYDLEMLKETGTCRGVENYSRPLSLKEEGATPTTLIDFFKGDFLMIIDESHATIPQIRGMYNGDKARKQVLIDYGFRLPSALDNRPLKFEEFEQKIDKILFVSATPGDYELNKTNEVVEQIIRPTGLIDPEIIIKHKNNQIDDLINEISSQIAKKERTLITTLTIRMAEELTDYLKNINIKVAYLHNEVKTLERLKIIHDLRSGKYDVLVGINLLREGLDLPEVSLVAIMDADKQGFLRSEQSLIQTIGRAARNVNGRVIMYADVMTDAIDKAVKETNRRREIQMNYNRINNITPKTIIKAVKEIITTNVDIEEPEKINKKDKQKLILEIEREMKKKAEVLDFEGAMELRDILFELKIDN